MDQQPVGSSSYDVFINFRGVDTRNTFVGHLYCALEDRGIRVFIDSNNLWKGEDIGSELVRAIKDSELLIAVFSERYTESKWCLEELAQMVECYRTNGQVIIPIFFKVETSDVKNQTGCFEISPQRPETLQRWKDALRVVGDKSGFVFKDGEDQSKLVKDVVQNVWIRLNGAVPLAEVKNPVGLESRVEYVLSLLPVTSFNDVQFLGICGPGGIGKTTIAGAVYNRIYKTFRKSFFLENVGERASQPNGIIDVQKMLLERISREEIKISSSQEGSSLIKKRLGGKCTLLILDDVGCHTQLKALAGDLNWFGPGSIIIITTRDHSLLREVPEDNRKIYEPNGLDEEERLQLFSKYAFSAIQPPNDYMVLSTDIVSTTGGMPLALQVLGSDLSVNKDKEVWNSMHQRLKQILHNDVYEKLKISFDNLDNIEKIMFLDVACFFIGWKEKKVISIWKACGFEPIHRMEVLMRKSLLKINILEELWMHDQIRDMGRAIVYNQSPTEPAMRSRLWSLNVIMKVLNSGKENGMVEGILHEFSSKDNICLHTNGFEKMLKLRLLQMDGATLEGSIQCLPSSLRWFQWKRCPLKKLPTNFCHEELVMLDLTYGLFRRAWNNWHWSNLFGNKVFQQLKVLKLSNCSHLSKSPNFSSFPCLERLYLDGCKDLIDLHESIGQLQELVYLNLESCSLKKLPNSICRLRSLQKLILNDCTSFEKLPGSIGDLKESLVELSLDRTNIRALPDSVGELKKLQVLNLFHWNELENLPSSMENMTSLRVIELGESYKLQHIPKLPSSLLELLIHYQHQYPRDEDMLELSYMEKLKCPGDYQFIKYRFHFIPLLSAVTTGTHMDYVRLMRGTPCADSRQITHRSPKKKGMIKKKVMGDLISWFKLPADTTQND
ncbi:disease resistance protein RUN1-like [Macadamia integrifolia]|uniref:disease resistance protein RUN1-like n=1 Tax=Macadamia integrifolia TaxID=60698 RepID=UPI001C4F57B9|nr:disease resistance protein RUN1-like [Macadamia integrifolia]XP_042488102.1 disease resistance protein RUN1-like [Macadamia integrifolia]XP_042488110.1 disease resistance protein RUN1-like [Macadamia integrifolia]XP_042488116.1 disease resistance protein RUN1-like [Macadamia integrifolia]XP_042488117.1 disease resistance protein RUN1-like [Macadamia integrifolia]XP_042488122.1 disease resistance protein RUN1-like [Macadamia integrifolia]XP_042488128.1 disease resistance protein RUN1-like [